MEEPRQSNGPELPAVAPASPAVKEAVKVAVALGYSPYSQHAPKVLAGGRGAVAEQTLNIAFAQGVRVREDADLVQLLAAVDVESEIPVEAFAAVAEILVYVRCANGAVADPGPLDSERNQPFMERAKGPAR